VENEWEEETAGGTETGLEMKGVRALGEENTTLSSRSLSPASSSVVSHIPPTDGQHAHEHAEEANTDVGTEVEAREEGEEEEEEGEERREDEDDEEGSRP
jgi:hypothetical protein